MRFIRSRCDLLAVSSVSNTCAKSKNISVAVVFLCKFFTYNFGAGSPVMCDGNCTPNSVLLQ